MKVYWNGLRNFHIVKPDDGILTRYVCVCLIHALKFRPLARSNWP